MGKAHSLYICICVIADADIIYMERVITPFGLAVHLPTQQVAPGGLLEPRPPSGASFPTVENRGKEGENHEHDVPQYMTHQSNCSTSFRTP